MFGRSADGMGGADLSAKWRSGGGLGSAHVSAGVVYGALEMVSMGGADLSAAVRMLNWA